MRKQDLIEMVVPIIGLVLMFVLLFVIRPSYKSMVSAASNFLITEKQYVDVKVEQKGEGSQFQAKDGNEVVTVYADNVKSCEDVHIGDKVNVMKYKSWAVSSPNDQSVDMQKVSYKVGDVITRIFYSDGEEADFIYVNN